MNTEQQQSHLTSDCVGDASKTALSVQHTDGPWEVIQPDEGSGNYIEIHDPFGHTATVYGDIDDAEIQANARLIGAAPDLLEALQRIVAHPLFAPCECGLPDCTTTVARAALAKAGVTP